MLSTFHANKTPDALAELFIASNNPETGSIRPCEVKRKVAQVRVYEQTIFPAVSGKLNLLDNRCNNLAESQLCATARNRII